MEHWGWWVKWKNMSRCKTGCNSRFCHSISLSSIPVYQDRSLKNCSPLGGTTVVVMSISTDFNKISTLYDIQSCWTFNSLWNTPKGLYFSKAWDGWLNTNTPQLRLFLRMNTFLWYIICFSDQSFAYKAFRIYYNQENHLHSMFTLIWSILMQ